MWLLISDVMNTWMYGGELDGVYVPSIDHFFKLTDYTLGTILYCILVLGGWGELR